MQVTPAKVTPMKVMDTLFRASDEVSHIFGTMLEKATDVGTDYLNCEPINAALKFALVSMYCNSCSKPHWSVLVKKHEDDFGTEINGVNIACLSACSSFEDAIEQFEAMMNITVKN